MYSTSIRDNRCFVQCIAVSAKICPVKFIVDTGAKFTCCNYTLVDINEDYFRDSEIKLLGGFVRGSSVKFYKYRLKQFTIGNINLGKQDIWITFDMRVTDTVLGMDILQQVMFTANPYDNKLAIFASRRIITSMLNVLSLIMH